MAVIQTHDLTKAYTVRGKPPFVALQSLDMTVEQGEIFGYLGPNGAGKTTTIRLLLDLIRPTTGTAQVMGYDVNGDSLEMRRLVGFLPGELNLWRNLTAAQTVDYVAHVRGGDVAAQKAHAREIGERLNFDFSKRIREYSTGNKRKLGLVLAMMHRPPLLILDEPTTGLDPLLQHTFNAMMREVRDEGRTVFLSSHMLTEVQAICDRVGIIRDGEMKAIERVDALTEAKFHWVTLQLREPANAQMLDGVAGVSDVSLHNSHTLRFRLAGEHDPLLRALGDYYVVRLETREPSLEEIFLTYYGNGESESAGSAAAVQKASE